MYPLWFIFSFFVREAGPVSYFGPIRVSSAFVRTSMQIHPMWGVLCTSMQKMCEVHLCVMPCNLLVSEPYLCFWWHLVAHCCCDQKIFPFWQVCHGLPYSLGSRLHGIQCRQRGGSCILSLCAVLPHGVARR